MVRLGDSIGFGLLLLAVFYQLARFGVKVDQIMTVEFPNWISRRAWPLLYWRNLRKSF